MSIDDSIRRIATSLLIKSRDNKVNWINASAPNRFTTFRVKFPTSFVDLAYVVSQTEADEIRISLLDKGGEPVASLAANDSKEDWRTFKLLWDEAHRYVTGWDKVLADIENGMKGDIIGLPERPKGS